MGPSTKSQDPLSKVGVGLEETGNRRGSETSVNRRSRRGRDPNTLERKKEGLGERAPVSSRTEGFRVSGLDLESKWRLADTLELLRYIGETPSRLSGVLLSPPTLQFPPLYKVTNRDLDRSGIIPG